MKMVTACCTAKVAYAQTAYSMVMDPYLKYKSAVCSACGIENPLMTQACDNCGKKGNLQSNRKLGDICDLCAVLALQPTIQIDHEQKRATLTTWMGSNYEISLDILSGGPGIVVKLYDGAPDALTMTVYWHGEPFNGIVLDEILDTECYEAGVNPELLSYDTGMLFNLQEVDKYDSEEYLLNGAMFTKNGAIAEAEKILREKYSCKCGGVLK